MQPYRIAALVAVMSLLLPLALAQDEGPNVTDPEGDAGDPVAVPVALAWGDILAVWFDGETERGVTARIQVASDAEPVAGEVALRFVANGTHYLAGWTTVAFPAFPFVYQGGFLCVANDAFEADPADCTDLAGVVKDGATFVVPLDRARLGVNEAGAVLGRVSAYADLFAANGIVVPVDRTDEGRDHVFATGEVAASAPRPTAPPPAAPRGTNDAAPVGREPVAEAEEAPGAGAVSPLVLAAALAAARMRRPGTPQGAARVGQA